ncbi:class I SAM-dependent methyltransferase [Nocardioides donggukensis]|uniref:Methyltransferase domain-containing protein n=1 Tax=Nocardioides donggukensis TaxID=2774019 RepID=A0A927K4X1_9ACTN|nr:class I SAM-dependent methyltransferase [Nocardioides donggukensis]MBD8869823.1 methyltransferase domain-containing protein [Nocardioides donggukensis]
MSDQVDDRPAGERHRSFSEAFTAALQGSPCRVVGRIEGIDGVEASGDPSGESDRTAEQVLPVDRWNGHVDTADRVLLRHCVGATLDVGCGPGRMSAHLAAEGHCVLGIDVVPEAVAQTRERGAVALRRDVFEPLPGEGRWCTALLADGNIGIGGDPVALLRRLAEVVAPDGRIVADLSEHGVGVDRQRMRLELDDGPSKPFHWAWVGADAIGAVAVAAGLRVAELHEHEDRWFVVLEKGARGAAPL